MLRSIYLIFKERNIIQDMMNDLQKDTKNMMSNFYATVPNLQVKKKLKTYSF